jgi:hypothetical protein
VPRGVQLPPAAVAFGKLVADLLPRLRPAT